MKLSTHIATTILGLSLLTILNACGGGGGSSGVGTGGNSGNTTPPVVTGPAWLSFAHDAQHTALAPSTAQGGVGAQNLNQIIWEATVDLAPPAGNTAIHYGSPLITANNTVVIPVKTTANGNFQVQARSGYNGNLLWSANSDYILPAYDWIPSFGAVLTAANRLYLPGSGGKLYYRDNTDSAGGNLQTVVFYGAGAYAAASSTFDANVYINTPLTADASGNVFFGFIVTGTNPVNLVSGFARVASNGTATWVAANTAAGQAGTVNGAMNAAPAVSSDGKTVYVSVRTGAPSSTSGTGTGYLLALDSSTLATKGVAQLTDPYTGAPAWVTDDSTASPLVGPDGDVYYGVLESNFPDHNARGWLLHFDATLTLQKTPGAFGWDDTPSIVPASAVTSYTGSSSYLLLSKYNNYADFPNGDGKNRMAILDPNATEADPVEGNTVMKEVMTVLGVTPDANFPNKPGAVKEWCINTAAVDPVTHSAFFNSEDGTLYRWDLSTGRLSQKIWLDNGYGQAYTPTALGPDGAIYSINAGSLFAVRTK
ncbi:MAG: hypothetical protein JO269_13740 [Burkholderiaceae bacterium]|nr:hypothetical protein [Burkholderiaceae bacterium]